MFKCLLLFALLFLSAGLFAQSKDIIIQARDGSRQSFLADSIVKIDFTKESTHALVIHKNDSSVSKVKLTEIENIIFGSVTSDLKDRAENKTHPSHFILKQNYPNPFNPMTMISYTVGTQRAVSLHVNLSVYNLLGKKIATLVNKMQQPGDYNVSFDAAGLSSGIYFYTLSSDDQIVTKKMLLLR